MVRATRRMGPVLGVLLLGAMLPGCVRNPATGERQFSLISESQEIQLGRDYDAQLVGELGLYPDPALQDYVHQLGSKMAALSERPHLPWTFRVVDDPIVNAFALPGGYIYITRGILAHLNSEAELASVIGHEIGHVTARHSVSRMSTQQLAQLGLGIGTILRPELETVANVASAGLGLLFLKYGRDDERQADDLGLRYMDRAGYDPREMPGVFSILEAVSEASGAGRIPEWLSSHPDPGNRRERISGQVATMTGLEGRAIERSSYIRRLDGLVYGDNPREGFFRGSEFLHPDLAFRLTFPAGWTTRNTKQAVVAISPNEDAILQLTLAEGATSPSDAANRFFRQSGVRPGSSQTTTINGLPAVTASFSAQTQSGWIWGAVAFIAYGDHVYQFLGYAPEARWGANQDQIVRAIESFARLTDSAALGVQPMRIRAVTIDREMTLEAFARTYAPGVDVQTVALLNNLRPTAVLVPGQVVKGVSGSPPPGATR